MEIEGTHDFIAILIGKFDGCLVSFDIIINYPLLVAIWHRDHDHAFQRSLHPA